MKQKEEPEVSEVVDHNDVWWNSLTDDEQIEVLLLVGLNPTYEK